MRGDVLGPPRSFARTTFIRDGKLQGTVWRDGRRYAAIQFDTLSFAAHGDGPAFSETWIADERKGNGVRAMTSSQRASVEDWLDDEGKLWLVYRGSSDAPPKVAGLAFSGYERSKTYRGSPFVRGPVVAIAAKLTARPPETLTIVGKRVPVRRIGRIEHATALFTGAR